MPQVRPSCREELASFPTDRKVELALELEKATRAVDARIRGLEMTEYGDSIMESAVATSTGGSRTSAADSPTSARVLITFHASAWNVRDVRPSRTSRARHSRKSPGRTGDRNSTCS